jgi:hypothetical protein
MAGQAVPGHWRPALVLGVTAAVLAAAAATAGLFWPDASVGATAPFTSIDGATVDLWNRGLYRHESTFFAAGFIGQDLVTLALAVPILIVACLRTARGTAIHWLVMRLAVLAYLLYVYATMALGAFYNELFLVYVATFSVALFATALTTRELDDALRDSWPEIAPRLPRRTAAVLLVICGLFTGLVWTIPLLSALLAGTPPPLLGHSTTKVTEALDLAVIVPSTLAAAGLIWRGFRSGYLLAVPLLGLIVMLFPTIAASTLSQIVAGIRFTPPEIAGPIGGFLVFGALGLLVLFWLVMAMRHSTP